MTGNDDKWTPGELRAVEAGLAHKRCPRCNRSGGVRAANRLGEANCSSCGSHYTIVARLERVGTNAGFRYVARDITFED